MQLLPTAPLRETKALRKAISDAKQRANDDKQVRDNQNKRKAITDAKKRANEEKQIRLSECRFPIHSRERQRKV